VLELPIEVVSGSIGKISLKIPWSSLATSPVMVTLEDVYIVALPLSHR
jgi:vacuolar protein sorting-associated protein 13A/C